jgi:serine acetyltransferase
MMHPSSCAARGHRRFSTVWRELNRDIERLVHRDAPPHTLTAISIRTRLATFLTPQILTLLLHRIAHCLHTNHRAQMAAAVSGLNFLLHKAMIAPRSCIAPGCLMPHPTCIAFDAAAGSDLTIYALSACLPDITTSSSVGPTLGDRVTIAGHVIVLGTISVGDDVRIAPHVRLDRDAPAGVLVVSKSIRATASPRSAT